MKKIFKGILLMILCAACLCFGQLVWKLMPGYNWIYLCGGFVIYAIGALSMVFAYRYGELSVLQPINSLSYVFSAVIGVLLLRENVSLMHIAGIVLILSGVVFIGVSNR